MSLSGKVLIQFQPKVIIDIEHIVVADILNRDISIEYSIERRVVVNKGEGIPLKKRVEVWTDKCYIGIVMFIDDRQTHRTYQVDEFIPSIRGKNVELILCVDKNGIFELQAEDRERCWDIRTCRVTRIV